MSLGQICIMNVRDTKSQYLINKNADEISEIKSESILKLELQKLAA